MGFSPTDVIFISITLMTQNRFNVKLVAYVVTISRGRWPEHLSGKIPYECFLIAYLPSSYVKGLIGTAVVWRFLRSPRVITITVFVILEKK
jgi:hypothetical protein